MLLRRGRRHAHDSPMKAVLWLTAGALLLWMGVPVQVLVGGYALLCLAIFAVGLAVGKAERRLNPRR